jgi:hypothetical protein
MRAQTVSAHVEGETTTTMIESHTQSFARRPDSRRSGVARLAPGRRLLGRELPLWADMVVVALAIALWQVARIPAQGSMPVALAHARDWLSVERALHVDVEAAVLRAVHEANLTDALWWCYGTLHLPVFFGFMAIARLQAPGRYPVLRTAFVLGHVPALVVITLYPLAPPRWFVGLPSAVAPPPGVTDSLHNVTAAAASQHVGYPLFMAAATVWLVRRSVAWLAFAYPLFTFAVVLGTGNHYALDAVVGGLCMALGFGVAWLLHGGAAPATWRAKEPLSTTLLAVGGYACVVHAVNTASDLSLPPTLSAADIFLVCGAAAVVAATRGSAGGEGSRPPVSLVPAEQQAGSARSGRG